MKAIILCITDDIEYIEEPYYTENFEKLDTYTKIDLLGDFISCLREEYLDLVEQYRVEVGKVRKENKLKGAKQNET